MKITERNRKICLAAAIIICIAAAFGSVMFGAKILSPADIFGIIRGGGDSVSLNILKYSRLPRTVGCLFAGAALAVSGAVLQSVLSNKLAAPGIIGINSGAGFGVTLCCAAGVLSGWVISAAAFIGSLITVALISILSCRVGVSKTTVILSGVAMNSVLSAFSESVTVLDPTVGLLTTEFRVGGFSAVTYSRLIPAIIIISVTLLILFTLTNELDVLCLGDESAESVGLNAKAYRMFFLILAALLAGAAVSFAGLLGFVGLIIPHFTRQICGGEGRYFLPLSAFSGAAFVTLCDTFSRIIFAPHEVPVGIIMSLIGGPLFIYILLRSKGVVRPR